jgi:hypothetical protein
MHNRRHALKVRVFFIYILIDELTIKKVPKNLSKIINQIIKEKIIA